MYALGRCKNCYSRYRRNGDDLSREQYTNEKYLGQVRKGWEVTEVIRVDGRLKLRLRCQRCGAERIVTASRLNAVGEHRECVVLYPKTEKQKEVARVLAENNFNQSKTAKILGKSVATISHMYHYMRNNYERSSKKCGDGTTLTTEN